MTTAPLSEQIELHRDRMWRRDEDLRVESAMDAERFIEDVGFANTLTDARRAGPSLYIAVCWRRDVSLPRNVQKDEESSLIWYFKPEIMRRGPKLPIPLLALIIHINAHSLLPDGYCLLMVRESREDDLVQLLDY